MTDTNHVGDLNEMGGDLACMSIGETCATYVHGDPDSCFPKTCEFCQAERVKYSCKSCGVPWVGHMGIEGTCAENKKLREERDEARREVCKSAGILRSVVDPNQEVDEWAKHIAKVNKWHCFKEEETQ